MDRSMMCCFSLVIALSVLCSTGFRNEPRFARASYSSAVVNHILDAFERTLKKNVTDDLWLCEEETCTRDADDSSGGLTWRCTAAVAGQSHLVGIVSGSCSKEGSTRVVGRKLVASQTQKFVDKRLAVEFVLPAFPYKSRNHVAKTLSELPDMGEALAIAALGYFSTTVQDFYPPGAHVTIVSDGHVFNDVAGVSDCALDAYTRTIRSFSAHYGRGHVSWAGLDTFVTAQDMEEVRIKTGDAPPAVLKRRTLENFLLPDDRDVESRIKTDRDYKMLYLGFVMFKSLDFGDMAKNHSSKNPGGGTHQGFSRKRWDEFVGTIAKKQMLRNQAYNRMLEARLACGPDKDMECVRLSIHPHPNDVKMGINLVVGRQASIGDKQIHDWPTPWHNAVVMDTDFHPQPDEQGFPSVVDSSGKPLPLLSLTHRWTAEHEDNASAVSLVAAAPSGYKAEVNSRTYEAVAGTAVGPASGPWDERAAACDAKDLEIPFWVCVARQQGYTGAAQYASACGTATSEDFATPIIRPFFLQ